MLVLVSLGAHESDPFPLPPTVLSGCEPSQEATGSSLLLLQKQSRAFSCFLKTLLGAEGHCTTQGNSANLASPWVLNFYGKAAMLRRKTKGAEPGGCGQC